jgi:Putative Flp pilus-assembly TadE/G-like
VKMTIGGWITAATRAKRHVISESSGSMTIPGLIFFTILMGVGGLTIDMQRLYGVHGQMQALVDAAALAGAAELDTRPGAIARAARAACGTNCGDTMGPLVTGSQKFANGPAALRIQRLTFLSQLDTDPGPLQPTPTATELSMGWVLCTYDGTTWSSGCATSANNRDADFIEVVAEPRTVSYLILPIVNAIAGAVNRMIGAPATVQTSAILSVRATAGYKVSVCDLSPMMICNPLEGPVNTDKNLAFTANLGTQIIIRAGGEPLGGGGSGGAWVPGDFGWLDITSDAGTTDCLQSGNNGQDTGCVLGLVDPLLQCFDDNQIRVNSGQATPTAEGLNVRFDIYPNNDKIGPASNVKSKAQFAPSVNVTKGICQFSNSDLCDYQGPAACPNPNGSDFKSTSSMDFADPASRSIRMPRDQTWDATGRFGNGDWDRTTYWQVNHGAMSVPAVAANWTRYRTYRNEIDCSAGSPSCVDTDAPRDGIPNYSPNGEIATRIGTPVPNSGSCSTQPGVNDPTRDRRLLYVAIVNCTAWGMNGASQNKAGITAVNYAKMFLTEPVGLDNAGEWKGPSAEKNVYAEIVDIIEPEDETNIVRVYPVLYR